MMFFALLFACNQPDQVNAPESDSANVERRAIRLPGTYYSKGGAPIKPPWYDAFFGKVYMPDPHAEKTTPDDTGLSDTDLPFEVDTDVPDGVHDDTDADTDTDTGKPGPDGDPKDTGSIQ